MKYAAHAVFWQSFESLGEGTGRVKHGPVPTTALCRRRLEDSLGTLGVDRAGNGPRCQKWTKLGDTELGTHPQNSLPRRLARNSLEQNDLAGRTTDPGLTDSFDDCNPVLDIHETCRAFLAMPIMEYDFTAPRMATHDQQVMGDSGTQSYALSWGGESTRWVASGHRVRAL